MKRQIDIEKLLHWAYRDELSKRATSSAEAVWGDIRERAQLGGIVDDGRSGGSQRYDLGAPHPDAVRVEMAVASLEDVAIDWAHSFSTIAAELSALVTVNEVAPAPKAQRVAVSEWTDGDGRRHRAKDRPRDVLLINSLRTRVLVTSHAVQASRPEWYDEAPQPHMVPAVKGPNAMVIGECRGRNLYTPGSHCPLKWEPSPVSIVMARAEYAAWHAGLCRLVASLSNLVDHIVTPPAISSTPWLEPVTPKPAPVVIRANMPLSTIPLTPQRYAPAPPRRPQHGAVRGITTA